ncbi:hypothetical protein IFR05_013835 [Cadophora sp. M221]|nr:hypothetical protein IFR05_013835 [Cadophora sp. M221]
MSLYGISPNVSPDMKLAPKLLQRLAKAVPRKLNPINKSVLTWLNGVNHSSLLPRFRVLVVCEAERKIFDLIKILVQGQTFSTHQPLVPEPIDGEIGSVCSSAREIKPQIAPAFVHEVTVDGHTIVIEWIVAKEEISAGQVYVLNFPVDERLLGPGFTIEEYEVPFLHAVNEILEEKGMTGGWMKKAKAKVANLAL